jgi:hypothetical protein
VRRNFRPLLGGAINEVLQYLLGEGLSEIQVEELGRKKEEYYADLTVDSLTKVTIQVIRSDKEG